MAGPWENYSSVAPPPWEQYAQPEPEKPKQGFGTGIGLGVRNILQGAASLPFAVSNAALGAYNLGADVVQGKDRGFRFRDQNQEFSDFLTRQGFPVPQTEGQEFGGAVIQGVAGGGGALGISKMLPKAAPMAQRLARVLGEDAPIRNLAAGGAVGGTLSAAQAADLPRPLQLAAALGAGAVTHSGPQALAATGRAAGRVTRGALASRLADSLPPDDAALVSQYEKMGGHLRPGQYSPSNFMRQGDAVISDTPWPRVSGFSSNSPTRVLPAQQADEFNTMLSRTFGEDAPRITDEVINRAQARIGAVYEQILPRNNVTSDEDLLGAIARVENDLAESAPAMKPEDVTRMAKVMNRISTLISGGGITGKQYQVFRQRGGILDELAGAESPTIKNAATNIRNALDDAFIRQAQGEDAAALTLARKQYRNLETLKPLAAKAPAGNVSPGLVLGAVNKEFGSPGAAGDLGTLARVGSAFLKQQPSSGTSERSVWRSMVNSPFSEGIPTLANQAISLPVSAVASRTLNKAINSPEMRAKLLAKALEKKP